MSKIRTIVEALKRGEEVEVDIELTINKHHLLLIIGIISFIVFRLLF